MKCEDAKSKLIEYVDRELPEPEQRRVSKHLEGCSACREEHDRLRQADESLRNNLSRLAPADTYLTSARRKALNEAHAASQRSVKLITLRRFVAAAAIAAIIASAWVMYPDLASFFGPPRRSVPADRVATGYSEISPLMVTSPGDGTELRVLPARVRRSAQAARGGRSGSSSQLNHAESVRMHPEWVVVPAENAYYDDSEAAYWW